MNRRVSDSDLLASLDKRFQVIRDHVTAVGQGYKTGLYIHGSGGIGKSFSVLQQLLHLGIPYELYNSRMTAKGLFTRLKKSPSAVHVLEDMERLTKDQDAQGVLRSALWAQPGHGRNVTWTTAGDGCQKFTFTGGVILISNCPLADLPELRALATRIEVYHLDVPEDELIAFMRELATTGLWEKDQQILPPDKCSMVTERLIKECSTAGCPLDLRLQQKAFQTYRQDAAGAAETHWEDLLAISIRSSLSSFRREMDSITPEAQKAQRRDVVREVMALTANAKEQEIEYAKRTGKSRADFFRRKSEVESGKCDEVGAA